MDRIEVVCKKCGYSKHLLYGSSDQDQTLSDLNEDFSYYRLYLCKESKEIIHVDVHDREMDGKCPGKDEELIPLDDVPHECPKCGTEWDVEKKMIPSINGGV